MMPLITLRSSRATSRGKALFPVSAALAGVGFSQGAIRIAALLLPAQMGDYLILVSLLPLSTFLPEWSARLISSFVAQIAELIATFQNVQTRL
jgi:hypothetical protein